MEEEIIVKTQEIPQMGAGIGIGMIIFWLVLYVFFAYCLARLAKKQGMPFGSSFVWAIIPIANVFLILKLAAKPYWWFILLLIPIVNIVVNILIWMAICEKMGRPGWWGIMIGLVPIANIVFFLMLVFGKEGTAPAAA
jgi:hypothetical protein